MAFGRAITLLAIYGGLAAGALWLGEAMERPAPSKPTLAATTTPPPAASSRDAPLPLPAAFLDESGRPRLDPEGLRRFLEEMNLLQRRIDEHRARLDAAIERATH